MKNKLLNLFMLVSFLPLVVGAAGTMKKNSKVILSGNILSNSQVVPVGGQVKTVMGAGSGKVRFSSTLYCGDGDVAHYQEQNPDTTFYGISTPQINQMGMSNEWIVTTVNTVDVALASNLTTNIVMGYWVSPESGPLDTSASKFFSIGYTKSSKVDADVTEKLISPNFASMAPKQNFNLIEDAMKDMATIAKSVVPASVSGLSNTKYNMKFVAMACPVMKNAGGVDSNSGLNNLKITRQFLTGHKLVGSSKLQDYMYGSSLNGSGKLNKSQVKVETAGSADFTKSVNLDFSNSSGENLAGSLVSAINNLADAPRPAVISLSRSVTVGVSPTTTISCGCQKLQYDADLASVKSAHEAFKNRMNQAKADKSICDAGSGISFTSTDYPWEVFRTNAACQIYQKGLSDLAAYEAAMAGLFGVASLNTDTCAAVEAAALSAGSCPGAAVSNVTNLTNAEFDSRKLEINKMLMKLVGTPNAVQVAQDKLKERMTANAPGFALNRASCFPINAGTDEYIKHISSSVGIHVSPDAAASGSLVLTIDPGAVSHPEGNFAIGGDAAYHDGSGNNRILFNNPPIADPVLSKAFKVETGMSDSLSVTTGTANVQFHIRAIGCSKNIYCYNDR